MENARSNADLFSSWTILASEVWYGKKDGRFGEIPAAAAHSRIRELERGILLVEADHPGWIQILQTKQKELLLAVKRRYPELDVRDISFRLSRSRQDFAPAPKTYVPL
jgi:predicted nucleic acid-binding Zn ribbon protein